MSKEAADYGSVRRAKKSDLSRFLQPSPEARVLRLGLVDER